MRHRSRTDSNHKEISKIMRDLGWTVKDQHSAGGGVLDIQCRRPDRTIDVEIKNPNGANKLTRAQVDTILNNENSFIARCEADCVEITFCPHAARQRAVAECGQILEKFGKQK